MVNLSSLWENERENIFLAIDKVAKSGSWILGNSLNNFESALSDFFKLKFCVGCASGLDAIEISLKALNLMPGDRVITTPLTAFATTLAIVKAGGVPVFVDVDECGLLDLDLVTDLIESDGSIKYLVPVHLFGFAMDLKRLAYLRDTFKISIVEDCAQSVGSRSSGILTGTVGQLSATSFYPTKNLGAFGDGGAILTNDVSLMRSCQQIRDYGQSAKYVHDVIGMNSRLDDIQAEILNSVMLPKLFKDNRIRSKIASQYLDGIINPDIKIIRQPINSDSSWHLFPVRINGDRDKFRNYMNELKIGTAVHYPTLCNQQRASEFFKYEISPKGLKCAEKISASVVSIPLHPYLTENDVARVIEACNTWRPE